MAKTVAKAKAAKAKAVTPKQKPKPRVSKKRKTADNPFESSPDGNQSSIRTFAKPPSEVNPSSSHQSATEGTAPHVPVDSSDDVVLACEAEPAESTTTTDQVNVMDTSGTGPESKDDETLVGIVDSTTLLECVAHDEEGNTNTDSPWSLPEFVAVSQDNMVLDEFVQAVRHVAVGRTIEQWEKICFSALSQIRDEEKIFSLIGQCREHPKFQDHVNFIQKDLADIDIWTFGDEAGDPLEDLSAMIVWLVRFDPTQQIDTTMEQTTSQIHDGDQSTECPAAVL